jgi:hypothetical protein
MAQATGIGELKAQILRLQEASKLMPQYMLTSSFGHLPTSSAGNCGHLRPDSGDLGRRSGELIF